LEDGLSKIAQTIIAESARLDALKQRINEEHRRCEEAVGSALEHAINAGEGLAQMKDNLSHGRWGRWLRENFEGSERTAQAYMRLYRRRDEIRSGASDLSIRGALSSLSVPKPEPAETVEEATVPSIPAGEVRPSVPYPPNAVTRERFEGPLRWAGEEQRQDYAKRVAAQKKASHDAEERYRQEQRQRHTQMFMEVDARVSKARRELKEAIDQGRDVQFSAEEVELLVRQGEAARDMASLFIGAVSGDSDTDWDAELYELEQRRQWGAEWKEE
jgi:hypothetical protein